MVPGRAGAPALIALSLANPAAQHLRRAADLGGNRADRGRLRGVLALVVENTIRTARARTSGGYGGLGLVMAPSFQDQEPPENPVRFTRHLTDRRCRLSPCALAGPNRPAPAGRTGAVDWPSCRSPPGVVGRCENPEGPRVPEDHPLGPARPAPRSIHKVSMPFSKSGAPRQAWIPTHSRRMGWARAT